MRTDQDTCHEISIDDYQFEVLRRLPKFYTCEKSVKFLLEMIKLILLLKLEWHHIEDYVVESKNIKSFKNVDQTIL